MEAFIWLGCAIVFALLQKYIAACGIELSSFVLLIISVLTVLLPAPVLCKEWHRMKASRSIKELDDERPSENVDEPKSVGETLNNEE